LLEPSFDSPEHSSDYNFQTFDLTLRRFNFLTLVSSRLANGTRLFAQGRPALDAALVTVGRQQRATTGTMTIALHAWLPGLRLQALHG
jgi:hypothetical protein